MSQNALGPRLGRFGRRGAALPRPGRKSAPSASRRAATAEIPGLAEDFCCNPGGEGANWRRSTERTCLVTLETQAQLTCGLLNTYQTHVHAWASRLGIVPSRCNNRLGIFISSIEPRNRPAQAGLLKGFMESSNRETPEKHDRQWFGMFIPAVVWNHPELNCAHKCLYAEIHAIGGHKGECFASNEYLGRSVGVGANRASVMVGKLIELGLVEVVKFDGKKRYLQTLFDRDSTMEDFAKKQRQPLRKHKGSLCENTKAEPVESLRKVLSRSNKQKDAASLNGKVKCKEEKQRSKETKAAPAGAVAVPIHTCKKDAASQTRTATASGRRPFADSNDFWCEVISSGLSEIYKRPKLFEELEAAGWKDSSGEPLRNPMAFLRGLDRKMREASSIGEMRRLFGTTPQAELETQEDDCPF